MPIFSSLYGTRLTRELGTEDSTVLFTTGRRKGAINEGQAEFVRLTKCFVYSSTKVITGGVAEYNLWESAPIVAPASSGVIAQVSGGLLSSGTYQFRFTYKDREAGHESTGSPASSATLTSSTRDLAFVVPNSTNELVDAVVIYARKVGEALFRKQSSQAQASGSTSSTIAITSTAWSTGAALSADSSAWTLTRFMNWTDVGPEFRYTDASSALTVLAGEELPQRTINWLNRYEPGWQVSTVASTVRQLPQYWYERITAGRRLFGLWPTPSTGSSASAVIVLNFAAQPIAMAADTDEPFQDTTSSNSTIRYDLQPYHQALVHYAAHQLEKYRRDGAASQSQFQMFLAYVRDFIRDHGRVRGGTHLTTSRNYFRRRARSQREDIRT
jgi:hypothetical protein